MLREPPAKLRRLDSDGGALPQPSWLPALAAQSVDSGLQAPPPQPQDSRPPEPEWPTQDSYTDDEEYQLFQDTPLGNPPEPAHSELLGGPRQPLPPPSCWPCPATAGDVPPPGGALGRLPPQVREIYAARRGVRKLYDWQEEVLGMPDVWDGSRNLVFALPTSGGKSLVAEILLLQALQRKRSALLVMPFVALVDEKIDAFEPFGEALGFDTEAYAGTRGRLPLPSSALTGRPVLAVSTIERANGLLNGLIEEGRFAELGCIVVDELHTVGEPGRGWSLETLLTKAMAAELQSGARCQIVGMSATLPNLGMLCDWLGALRYETDFRPVQLRQHLRLRDAKGYYLVDENGKAARRLPPPPPDDRDHLAHLVFEAIPQYGCLVFCPSKAQCSNVAQWLTKRGPEDRREKLMNHRRNEKDELLRELKAVSATLDPALAAAVRLGVAYHHAGLLAEERQLIEHAYRNRVLCCICCTSTLAAGVNLPARRVVIKGPHTGMTFLTKSRYLQMCGRAGRAGLDDLGESFLLAWDKDMPKCRELLSAEIEPLCSQMLSDGVQRTTLDTVATGLAADRAGLRHFVGRLMCTVEQRQGSAATEAADWDEPVWKPFATALDELIGAGMIGRPTGAGESGENAEASFSAGGSTVGASHRTDPGSHHTTASEDPRDGPLALTAFGHSAFRSGFTVNEANLVKQELRNLQEGGLVLADDLHMVYFLTPMRDAAPERGFPIDWACYWKVFGSLSPVRHRIASLIGVEEGYILQQSISSIRNRGRCGDTELIARRFYLALLVADLLNEVPFPEVSLRYGVDRGQLQQLLNSTAVFSAMMVNFAEAMGWTSLQMTIATLVKRLGCGVKADLVELTEIKGVQAGRARLLWNAGLKTIRAVAAMQGGEELHRRVAARCTRPGHKAPPTLKYFSTKVAGKIVEAARALLRQQLREKRQEVVELGAIAGDTQSSAQSPLPEPA